MVYVPQSGIGVQAPVTLTGTSCVAFISTFLCKSSGETLSGKSTIGEILNVLRSGASETSRLKIKTADAS